MIRKVLLSSITVLLLSACSIFSGTDGQGQVIYHWQRSNTGVERFVRDHNYCMREAEPFKILPRFQTLFHDIFYSEEKKLEVRANWEAESGIWASYVPYRGAQPIVVNYLRDDSDANPSEYSACMKKLEYTIRGTDIPVITNINLHNPYIRR